MKPMNDSPSTWLRIGPLTAEQRRDAIASVGDTITAEEAASLIGCTVAEVQAEVAALGHRIRIAILGGPRTGKTTLARLLDEQCSHRPCGSLRMTDDLIEQLKHLGKHAWSEASRVASTWLDEHGPWIVEGVALARALRKWREAHPDEAPPVDRVIRLTSPHVKLTKGQATMAKGEETVWREIEPWLRQHGVSIETVR